MKKLKILITGSSGTIGTRLFEKLLEQGHEVVGFDRQPNHWHSALNTLTIQGDLLREKDLDKLPIDIDMIVHLAANTRVYKLVLNPSLALENIVATHHILEFARKHNIHRFIFSSSGEVYGNRKRSMFSEKEVNVGLAENPYAASKIADEALIYAYHRCFDIHYLILRFSNVYGRYDITDRFVPHVMKRLRENQEIFIYGKDKLLDFTYIDDCIDGIIKGIVSFSRVRNDTLNIASGRGDSLTEVTQLLKQSLGSKSILSIRPNRIGEVVQYVADISKAKHQLGYTPRYSLQQGIKATIDWYSNYYQTHNRGGS